MKRRYGYRPVVQLAGKSDAQIAQCAREAKTAAANQHMQVPSYRQPAVAHFAGFWADESEDGAGDDLKASGWGLGACLERGSLDRQHAPFAPGMVRASTWLRLKRAAALRSC